jgi:hypothetical protein
MEADVAAQPIIRHAPLTAIVHAVDGVRFVATADRPADLVTQIIDYIRARCDYTLWPRVARDVRALIDEARPYAAIALYFARVGERWDAERLDLDGVLF